MKQEGREGRRGRKQITAHMHIYTKKTAVERRQHQPKQKCSKNEGDGKTKEKCNNQERDTIKNNQGDCKKEGKKKKKKVVKTDAEIVSDTKSQGQPACHEGQKK
jgi:hypothetical protein